MNYEEWDLQLKNAVVDFGDTLIAWRKQNGWTQYTVEKWAKYDDIHYPSSGNLSVIENGKNFHPRPITFVQFGCLNAKIANLSDNDLRKIKDRELRDRIKGAKPIETFSCGIWEGHHFFMHFIGVLPRPKNLQDLLLALEKPPIATSKEEAFMMLTPGRFTIEKRNIFTPVDMTADELSVVNYLSSDHGYKTEAKK